jgi:hypothetical protein
VSTGLHTVHVRVNDAATGQPTPGRIRFADAEGNYYAPLGRLANFSESLRSGGNIILGGDRYAYIDGTCEINLPLKPLVVEVFKGFEYTPIRQELRLGKGQMALRLTINRWADLRSEGWYSGDTRCHFLSPHAALLEGAAEDLAVVNLLATVYGERALDGRIYPAFSNLTAFSGQKPALTLGGHMVVVNTFNTHPVLGRLALLNCHRVVYPLQFGKWYSSFEDPSEVTWDWTLADWCDQCHRKQGLVVWVVKPWQDADPDIDTLGEAVADLILGKIDALEPRDPALPKEWYQLLNCGFRVPLVVGSGKTNANGNLGNFRTYALLEANEEFTYKSWIEAVRAGRTFVTNGPLLTFTVNGRAPGSVVDLHSANEKLEIRAEAKSLVPFDRLEVVSGQENVVVSVQANGSPAKACLEVKLPPGQTPGGWLAARCVGEQRLPKARGGDSYVFAHTSPVYVQVAGRAPSADANELSFFNRVLDDLLAWTRVNGHFTSDKDGERFERVVRSAQEELHRRGQL